MSRVLLSGFRVRVLDANGHPDVYPCRIVFTDSSTTQPKAVYSGPLVGDSSLGTIVNLDAQGFGPANGIWLGTGEYNIAIQHNVGENLYPNWQILWTTNHIQGGFDDSNVDDTSIRFVNTVPDIRGLTILGGIIFNMGYYTLNDGGEGEWRWMKDSLEVDDGGAYLIPTGQSTSTAGRWHRVMPNGGEADVRMWGAVTGQPDVSGNIELAQQWCSRTSDDTGTTLAFPAASYNISTASLTLQATGLTMSGSTREVKYHIYNNARFLGTAGVAQVHFNGPTQIDSTSSLGNSGLSLYFVTYAVPYIDTRWWNNTSIRSRLLSSDSGTVPIYLNESASITSATTLNNRLIIGPAGAIAMTQTLTLKGGVEVQGNPRIALGVGVNGNYVIRQTELQAWWFGYGSLPDNDQAVALTIAMNIASASNATLNIDSITAPKGIYSQCGREGTEFQCRISGTINLYTGSNLYLPNVLADRKHIFNVLGTSAAPVTIEQGVVFPEWFGAKTGLNSNDGFHWLSQCFYRSTPKGVIRWIDGGGAQYTLTETIYMTAGSVGLRDMSLVMTTETASTSAIYIGGETNTTNYEIKDVLIYHTANGERRPTILMDHAFDVFIRDTRFSVNHGIALTAYGSGRLNISNNSINLSNGAIMWATPTLKADTAGVQFFNNTVYGLNNLVYGTSATVQTLPNLFSHVYNNSFVADGDACNIDLCRDSTLDVGGGQIQLHDNIFMGCNLKVRTKFMVDIHNNVMRMNVTSTPRIKFIGTTGEIVTGLYIRNNQARVEGDFSAGYPNAHPSVFGCGIWGNGADSTLSTHRQAVIQRTYADTTPNQLIGNLFPYAYCTSLQVTMLSTNSGMDDTDGYSYAIIGSVGIGQDQYKQLTQAGKFEIANTRANRNDEDDRDWIHWSCNIGCSNNGPV